MYRLVLTACRLFKLHIALRCAECHEVRNCGRCQCGGGGARRAAQLEVDANVEVSDGSDRAYLDVSGPLVWMLLQCPPTAVRALSAAAAACGPLSCQAASSRGEDIVRTRGAWTYGLGAAPSDAQRAAVNRALPVGASWQREFVAYCRCTNKSEGWKLDDSVWVDGAAHATVAPEKRTKLQAVRIAPLWARQELERLLGE